MKFVPHVYIRTLYAHRTRHFGFRRRQIGHFHQAIRTPSVGTVELEKRDGNSTGQLPRMERDAMVGLVKVGGTPEREYCYNGFWLLVLEQVSSPYVFHMIIIVL